jgi:Mg-chelatase subunit ChlD
MMRLLQSLFLFPAFCYSQITFSEQNINLGTIPKAWEICGQLVVSNTTDSKVFLMRADASPGVKIHTSKKTLLPGDTGLLVISFYPERKGKFHHTIRLVSSESAKPHEIKVWGNLLQTESNDRTACYYFGKRNPGKPEIASEPIVMKEAPAVYEDTPPLSTTAQPAAPDKTKSPAEIAAKHPAGLDKNLYVPNNLVFLVDVSGSMKDSLKLPLMKRALHTLIDAVRDVDSITLITYADTIKILNEAISGSDKKTLHDTVGSLKARGLTRGRKAIEISQKIGQKHYIEGGNNMVFIVSDGKFRFDERDYEKWQSRQGTKKLIITTIALGDEREAVSNLKHIAKLGNGTFIHFKGTANHNEQLLNEVKQRSSKK